MAEIKVASEEDFKLLQEIQEKVMVRIHLGFNPEVLEVLDNENSTHAQIESLKDLLGEEIVIRLFGIGNSIYYGRIRAGKISNFFDIVLRLGMEPTKVYIICLSQFFIRPDKELLNLAARSFITSILGRMLAKQLGMKDEEIRKVELGGLFLEIGKVFILLYNRQEKKELSEAFISKYYPFLGLKMVEKFELPEFLGEILSSPSLDFEENRLSLPGIVHLVHSIVETHFKENGRLVIRSPMPDADGVVISTYGSVMRKQLEAVGLENFLEIIPILTPQQQLYQEKVKSSSG